MVISHARGFRANVRGDNIACRELVCRGGHHLNCHAPILVHNGIICNRLDTLRIFLWFASYSNMD
nr:MAG TPA: hypothetical protein [Caudoviricetes sp.]